MTIRPETARTARATYEDMPFTQVLFRYMWPFWLFKDASRGDRLTRAAAYRHNRSMRVHLPAYLLRWVFGSALAFGLTAAFDALAMSSADAQSASVGVFTLIAAGGVILFAASLCILVVTGYVYLYLSRHAD